MYDFLSQFIAENNWAVLERDLVDNGSLRFAIDRGLVEYWKPPKGSSYSSTLLCTPKGRLYMRKNNPTTATDTRK